MKNKPLAFASITFISGIILGIFAMSLLAFTPTSSVPGPLPAVSKITTTQARSWFLSYYNTAQPINAVLKGITINKEQLQALNQLSNENTGLSGFRIYMGLDETNAKVGIVVGVNSSGNDVSTSIYRSNGVNLSPCPPICDASSPIIGQ